MNDNRVTVDRIDLSFSAWVALSLKVALAAIPAMLLLIVVAWMSLFTLEVLAAGIRSNAFAQRAGAESSARLDPRRARPLNDDSVWMLARTRLSGNASAMDSARAFIDVQLDRLGPDSDSGERERLQDLRDALGAAGAK